MDEVPAAIPAATLVVFRDGAAGAPELLMVERARAMAFAGGAMVFPGGRIDPGDHAFAALNADPAIDPDDIAARVAAVRETIEEAGLATGLSPAPDAGALAALRDRLHTGTPIGAALAEAGLTFAPHDLVPFARWRPAHRTMRIFDTMFYLARSPEAAQASVDATENVRLVWTTAQGLLDAADAGEVAIIFPTRRNLERLARFATFEDAVADAHAHPIRIVSPWEETRGGARHLCIPDDLGYPVTSERLADAARG